MMRVQNERLVKLNSQLLGTQREASGQREQLRVEQARLRHAEQRQNSGRQQQNQHSHRGTLGTEKIRLQQYIDKVSAC